MGKKGVTFTEASWSLGWRSWLAATRAFTARAGSRRADWYPAATARMNRRISLPFSRAVFRVATNTSSS